MPAKAGIQVNVSAQRSKRLHSRPDRVWGRLCAGMTDITVDFQSTNLETLGLEPRVVSRGGPVMEERRKLRFGVIGTGEFAQACHVPGLQSHPQAEVVALCGSDYDRARGIADRLGIPEVHTDYMELCSRGDLDGVTIATPNAFHSQQALAAFFHGKHVLCEKPLARTTEEAAKMLRAAQSSGKVHQVAFTFRYGYAVRELRRRVQAGDIGQPHYVRIQYDSWKGLMPEWEVGWRENRELAGGGVLYDLGRPSV